MTYDFNDQAAARVDAYVSKLGSLLGNVRRRASFATYMMGLLGKTERKSMEPMASAASGDPETCSGVHQRLQQFISDSDWDDEAVRLAAAEYAIAAMEKHEPVTALIIDDTGFLKQGKHSVGVQRQYTGSAGKITNCQLGVSLSVSTSSAHLPIDFELYLPEQWTDDPKRRKAGKIPDDVVFRSKEDLALAMIERAALAKIPGDIVLADAWYGRSATFRDTVQVLGFDYAVGILASATMWRLNPRDAVEDEARNSAEKIAAALLPQRYRMVTWREGVSPGRRRKLRSRFAFVRVGVPSDAAPDSVAKQWLLIEWPEGETKPTGYALTTLPRRMAKREIVRLFKERYRTERVYEEMKGEVGLDHFEGRSFRGWHHHVTVALAAYAFVVAELVGSFSPSGARTRSAHAIASAA